MIQAGRDLRRFSPRRLRYSCAIARKDTPMDIPPDRTAIGVSFLAMAQE
jgi:hypothetical protein